MRDWQRIRAERDDLTDYVVHFTKPVLFNANWENGYGDPFSVFMKIVSDGIIFPTFAPIKSKQAGSTSNTVRGPYPAVCLTEQPLSAVVRTLDCLRGRYSGYGVAYHKYDLFTFGARPVLYGSKWDLGTSINEGEPGYQSGREIYRGGLPLDLQYLFVTYKPEINPEFYPVDFTWEREWRFKCDQVNGLPVFLQNRNPEYLPLLPSTALIVERDADVPKTQAILDQKIKDRVAWAANTPIISLETARLRISQWDERYRRVETWPI